MLNETLDYLEKRQLHSDKFTYEIIVVDDGSKDNTYEVSIFFMRTSFET